MVVLGLIVTGPIEVDQSTLKASEVPGVLICGVDADIVVSCRLTGLTTWAQKPPMRRRSKAISRVTGGNRSWDLNVGKLQKNTQRLGRETWPPPSFCPLPYQLPSPTCGLTFLFFFFLSCFHYYQRQEGNRWCQRLLPWPWQLRLQSSHGLLAFTHCSSQWLLTPFYHHPIHLFKLFNFSKCIGTFLHPLSNSSPTPT